MHIVPRAIFGVIALLFGYAAFLQLNDPDPLMWVAIWGMAAGICLLAASNHEAPPTFTFAVGGSALFWGLYTASLVYGDASLTPMVADQQMTGNLLVETEEGREMGGLFVIAATMAAVIGVQIYERRFTTKRRHQDRR